MNSALIVSHTEKGSDTLAELLGRAAIGAVTSSPSCKDARKILAEMDFDLVVINAPLRDETGESLARTIAANSSSQAIMVVGEEYFESASARFEENGIITIAKPINREMFLSTLRLVKSTQKRLIKALDENEKLRQKIEDIRIIDRAKCILISYMGMSEHEAHRYIEKQAMDMRSSKRIIAEGLLKTYEN